MGVQPFGRTAGTHNQEEYPLTGGWRENPPLPWATGEGGSHFVPASTPARVGCRLASGVRACRRSQR